MAEPTVQRTIAQARIRARLGQQRADEQGEEVGCADPEEERIAVAQLCDHAPSSESVLILTVRIAK